jgi:transposase
MDAKLYCEILEDELLNTLDHYDQEPEDIIFQQDNDPKHTSRLAKKWFEDHNIKVLDWPPQSPDLNPIEHLWSHLKQKLADFEEPPKEVNELWDRVQEVWETIEVEYCRTLIESMPDRIRAVLKAKGGYTRY